MRRRRIGFAIALMIAATVVGSLVPMVSRHLQGQAAGLVGGGMLVAEIAAYSLSLALVIRTLRASARTPVGRGSSHL